MSSQLEACIKQLTMINEKLNRQANALDEIENEVEAVMHSISAVYNVPVPPLIPVHIENLTYRHAEVHADTNFQVPLSRLSKRASIRRSNQLVLAAVGNARRNDTGDVSTDVRSSVLMDSQIEIAMSNYAYEDATSVPSKSNSTRKTSVISRVITKTKSRGSQKSFRGSSSGHKLEKQTDLAITPEPQEINDPFKESKPAKRRGSMLNSTNISSLSDGEMQPSISRRTSTRKKNAPIDSSNNSSNEDSSKQTRRRPSMLADLLNDKNSKLVTGSNSSSDVPFTNSGIAF